MFGLLESKHNVVIDYIQPGKPAQNGYIERFNRTFREDILDQYIFTNLEQVREISSEWMVMYDSERPHSSLDDLTPWAYLAKYA